MVDTGFVASWRAEVGLAAKSGTAVNIMNASERLIPFFTGVSSFPATQLPSCGIFSALFGTVALPREQRRLLQRGPAISDQPCGTPPDYSGFASNIKLAYIICFCKFLLKKLSKNI